MNKRKLFLWADANNELGYGHFIRTSTLAQMMVNDFDCTFFTTSPNVYQLNILNSICHYESLPSEENRFELFLEKLSSEVTVFLDGYFFDSVFQKRVREKCRMLVCMADTINYFNSDAVIGYIIPKEQIKLSNETKYYCGLEWILLRQPFTEIAKRKKKEEIKSITICLGGTDQFMLTEKVVDLINSRFSLAVNVVSSFSHDRKKMIESKGCNVYSNLDAKSLCELFLNSDIVVASASTTAIESIAIGVPTIIGYYVDNQRLMYSYLVENAYAKGVGDLFSNQLDKILNEAILNIDTISRRLIINQSKEKYIELFSNGRNER